MAVSTKPGIVFQRLWHWNVAAMLGLIALAWPGLWLLWINPSLPPPRPAPVPAPVIRHMLTAPTDPDLWSPLLFSLPTPYGFSRTVQMAWLETRGVPLIEPPKPPLLAFPADAFPLPSAGIAIDRPFAVARYNPPPRPRTPPPPPAAPAPFWQASSAIAARGFSLPEAWVGQLPGDAGSGALTAVIDLGADGAVRHVFVTAPHPQAAINRALVPLIRQSRAQPTESSVTGTITIVLP